MAECIFCGHKFKGDKCDLCGTGYTWHQLLNAKERKEQQALADAGDVKASLRIGQYLHNQQDYKGCMPYLWTAANAGEGEAQSLLGQIYYHGLGTTPNIGESIMWHKMAAENGNGDSMFDMGLFYATGEGVDKDNQIAISFFKKGAAIGHAKSLSSLGKMYYQGQGVEENKEIAIIYFKMAAEAGDEDSGGFLGWLQSKGELPEIDEYKPTESGEPPLGRAKLWAWDTKTNQVVDKSLIDHKSVFPLELNTMPGFAGSSAYYLRYMDPKNEKALVSKEADEYWRNVDLYVGGTEHATGHLIYSRFWNKFLFDSGYSCEDEPFKKLVNQGMIQGRSNFVYRINDEGADKGKFVSLNLKGSYKDVTPIHVDVNIVSNDVLDQDAFRAWRPEYEHAEFILEDGKYICGWAIEKMSKSMFNVVNPDMIVERYGADTLRLYEMFLGPVEQSKPWDTNGIDGCHRFLKKFWALFYGNSRDNADGKLLVDDAEPTKAQLKSVHKLIKKVSQDIEEFSYNTSISAFMICVGEMAQLKCHNRELLRTLVTLLAPFAPHISEELWEALGETGSVCDAPWPTWNEEFLVEDTVKLGVAFNGKTRFDMEFAANADNKTIEEAVMADPRSPKYIDGKQVVKVIIVPKRMVNIVCK